MPERSPLLRTAIVLAGIAGVACAAAAAAAAPARAAPPPGYTAADVHFMSGMIHHHAQAVLIAGWAPTHEASPSLRVLCERIVVAQRDEIALMRRWLEARHEEVPDSSPAHAMMPGMDHAALMPGMLTATQLSQLDRARGPEFDRLFLTFMIQHHLGAITMVNQLFGQGAGEQETVFRFAADVYADQSTEIARMQKMLAALVFEGHGQ
jgi:uncharacterized protein (DUF305 family)